MMIVLFLLLAFVPEYPAIFFGGSGCGCQPAPPPQVCPPPPPPCPQLTLPCPPPPPCFCPPPLPPPPPLPCPCLPCPPQPCAPGCKRKKRSAPVAAIIAGNGTANNEALCNSRLIRKIILKNLNADPKLSKAAIYSELKAKQPGDYVVLCSQSNFSFTADSTSYCVDGSANQTCYVFQI